jgi:DNA-binding response OmpR family regulator
VRVGKTEKAPAGERNNRSMAPIARVLLVEDDIKLSRLVQEFLQRHGFDVAIEERGDLAIGRILQEIPDLVILDLMLPGKDGLEVCRQVRSTYKYPILMLTARGDENDELLGLESGADDYLSKPVSPQLLLARIKTLLRRSRRFDNSNQHLQLGDITLDANRRTVHSCDRQLELTTAEFDLLWLLASHAGEILTRDQISHSLLGHEWDGAGRSIDLSVSRLRRKLGDDGKNPERIRSIRGTGYLWVVD